MSGTEDGVKKRIDAYAHVGYPRFGTAAQAMSVLGSCAIDNAVLVLGPGMPDYAELFRAIDSFGESVRGVGIPFGETTEEQNEIVALQLRAGVFGIRLQPNEIAANPELGKIVARAGRWVYAIGCRNAKTARYYCDLADEFPDVKIAAAHYLQTSLGDLAPGESNELTELFACPGFHIIFSRHGGMGSHEPYPHSDLKPWVETVIERAGMERVMWGSEYPVCFWRNETVPQCMQWLETLCPEYSPEKRDMFLGGNAQRILFSDPPPARETVAIPPWVERQFDRNRTVPLFPSSTLDIPMESYAMFLSDYCSRYCCMPELRFADYMARQCVERSAQIGRKTRLQDNS
jgi:hypothetical protein